MKTRPVKCRQGRQGFALAAVLWLLAGLAIVVASVGGVTVVSAERVARLRGRADFMQSAYGTRAQLLYWLSGTGTDANGFTDDVQRVRADGTPYRVLPGSTVSLQDVGGLIGVNAPNRPLLKSYLRNCGVADATIDPLIDALQDRAEEGAFQTAGSGSHRQLLVVDEIWRLKGWAAVRSTLEERQCEQNLTAEAAAGTSPNPGTAPAGVLEAMGVPEDLAQSSVRDGRGDLAAVQESLQRLAPYTRQFENFGGTGAWVQRTLRVVHNDANGNAWRLEYTLRLTPDTEGRPWQIVEPTLQAAVPPPRDQGASALPRPEQAPALPWPDDAPAKQIPHVKKLLSF